jgi:hypothetical protein
LKGFVGKPKAELVAPWAMALSEGAPVVIERIIPLLSPEGNRSMSAGEK